MNIDVDIKDNSDLFLDALPEQIKNALWSVGAAAEGHAKENLTAARAVVTGRLRNSISHAEDEDSTYIGTNVEYAPFVEFGSRGREGVHYLKDAATAHSDEYKAIVKDALKQ